MNRNKFLKTGLITASALITTPALVFGKNTVLNQDPPQLDKELVSKFVGAGHGKMDVVKELLEAHPTLLNAAHDWRGGDFETALGAASHVGYKKLAQYLIDKGAQTNLFTAALFGRMDIIKPMLEFFPKSLHTKGPHGYTLLHHANVGGREAEPVAEYLKSLGAKETKIALY